MDKNMCSDEEYIRALREGKPAKPVPIKDVLKQAQKVLNKELKKAKK